MEPTATAASTRSADSARRSGALPVRLARTAAVLLPALLAAGCAQAPSKWYRDVDPAPPELERAWEEYGWYVVDLRYSFSTRPSLQGTYRGPVSYAHLYLVAKALAPGASRLSSLEIPGWNRSLHSMEVTLIDSSGKAAALDQERIREGYSGNGVVSLPRIGKGDRVAVRITQGPFSVLDHWEYSMHGPAPIHRSTFEFVHPMRLPYHYKGYNGLAAPRRSKRRQSNVLSWTAENILPMPDLPYLDAMGARPRLVIASASDEEGRGFPDWSAVAAHRERQWFGRTTLNRTDSARSKARELAPPGADDPGRARALFAFVRDSLEYRADTPPELDPDQVLGTRQANAWQAASLLEEMCVSVGLDAEIVLTRDRERGGFDPLVVNPNAAWEPLVLIKAGDREWAAYPQDPAYGLGDYPPGLSGMPALSLRTRSVRALPEPARPVALLAERHVVRLDSASKRRLVLEMEGPFASLARSYWFAREWVDTLDFCRSFLEAVGFAETFQSCRETDLTNREAPLRLELDAGPAAVRALAPDTAPASGDAASPRWVLEAPFSRPAWFYDSARTEDYHFPYEQRRRQTLVLEGAGRLPLEIDIHCPDADAPAVHVECEKGREDGKPAFTREVLFRKGRFEASSLRSQHQALTGLDRGGEARVLARRDPASAP